VLSGLLFCHHHVKVLPKSHSIGLVLHLQSTAPDSMLYSSQMYIDECKLFDQREKVKSVVVLDLFSGIGNAIVVLKLLGIPMKTVVHVEHDLMANYVNKCNHELREDGIRHVYVDKFEDIFGDAEIERLIEDHGPFDIVMAAAPCQDYCE